MSPNTIWRCAANRPSAPSSGVHVVQSCKAKQLVTAFQGGDPDRLRQNLAHPKALVRDALPVNAIRYTTMDALKAHGLPITCGLSHRA